MNEAMEAVLADRFRDSYRERGLAGEPTAKPLLGCRQLETTAARDAALVEIRPGVELGLPPVAAYDPELVVGAYRTFKGARVELCGLAATGPPRDVPLCVRLVGTPYAVLVAPMMEGVANEPTKEAVPA